MPCTVGFELEKDEGCPLYQVKPTIETLNGSLEMVARVVRARAPLEQSRLPRMPKEENQGSSLDSE